MKIQNNLDTWLSSLNQEKANEEKKKGIIKLENKKTNFNFSRNEENQNTGVEKNIPNNLSGNMNIMPLKAHASNINPNFPNAAYNKNPSKQGKRNSNASANFENIMDNNKSCGDKKKFIEKIKINSNSGSGVSEELFLIENNLEDILQQYQEDSVNYKNNFENINKIQNGNLNFKKENLSNDNNSFSNDNQFQFQFQLQSQFPIPKVEEPAASNKHDKDESIDINKVYDELINELPTNEINNENEPITIDPDELESFLNDFNPNDVISSQHMAGATNSKNNDMRPNICPTMNYYNYLPNDVSYKIPPGSYGKCVNSNYNNSNLIPMENKDNYSMGNGQFIERFCHNHTIANLAEWQREFEWDKFVENANLRAFGFQFFRPNQREIINANLSGRDIFVCMPTGGGKSLTFQIPALVSNGVTLVVMPLISLIQDQVSFLTGLGMKVIFLNAEGMIDIERNYETYFFSPLEDDHCKLVFLTPEKIAQSQRTMTLLKNLYNANKLLRVVIDEAHCVSQWGREFRPDYLNLRILKTEFPGIPILAITATAPNKIREDIITQLRMENTLFFRSSYNRNNLYIEIRNKKEMSDIVQNMANFIKKKYPDSTGLVYCSSKKDCEKVAEKLRTIHKLSAEFYHASMPERRKNEVQDRWKNDEIKIIVATVAFGMGINKADVRFVIHYSMPKSFEGYYQEIGRAGRDGNKSHCLLYYNQSDRRTIEYLMSKTNLAKQMIVENLRKMTEMIEYCEESCECRRVIALLYFDEKFDRKDCGKMCDNCRKGLITEEKDVTSECWNALEFLHKCHKGGCEMSLLALIDYLRGLKKQKNKKYPANDNNYGALSKTPQDNLRKMIRRLIILKYVDETLANTQTDKVYTRLSISNDGIEFLKNKDKRIVITFPQKVANPIELENPPGSTNKVFIDKINSKDLGEFKNNVHDDIDISNLVSNNPQKVRKYARTKTNDEGKNEEKGKEKEKEISIPGEDYGYCNQSQFVELLDKLKLKRREIVKAENRKLELESNNAAYKTLGVDDIFPLTGLKDFCRKLPTSESELNINYIFGVGAKMLNKYGPEFLPEIIKHVNLYEIKTDTKNYQDVVNKSIIAGSKKKTIPKNEESSIEKSCYKTSNIKEISNNNNKSYVKDSGRNGNLNLNLNSNENFKLLSSSIQKTEKKKEINFSALDNEEFFNSFSESRDKKNNHKNQNIPSSSCDNKPIIRIDFTNNIINADSYTLINDFCEDVKRISSSEKKNEDNSNINNDIQCHEIQNSQDYHDFNRFDIPPPREEVFDADNPSLPNDIDEGNDECNDNDDDQELNEFRNFAQRAKDLNSNLNQEVKKKRRKGGSHNEEPDDEQSPPGGKKTKNSKAEYFKRKYIFNKINAARRNKKNNNFQ